MYLLEQLEKPLGNLTKVDFDLKKIWFSETAKKQRISINNHECHCTYECVSSCNIFFNPRHYASLLIETLFMN